MDDFDIENTEEETTGIEENIPSEMELDPPQNALMAEGSKKLVEALLKKKKFIILAAGGIGFFLFIILLTVFSNTNLNKKPYFETECEKVTVTYLPFNGSESSKTYTMNIEDYIKKAVYEYTKNFQNPPNGIFQVYYVLAASLRTEVISNNCKITYRDKSFSTEVPKDSILENALTVAKGIVIGNENDELLPVKVTNFCWSEKSEEEYKITEGNKRTIPSKFIYDNTNNEIYKECPCNRPDDSLDQCWVTWEEETEGENGKKETVEEKEWLHKEQETSGYTISAYAVYYLMHKEAKGYDEILRYFFGNNMKYMTIYDRKKSSDSLAMENGNMSSSCNTSSSSANLLTFLSSFEGSGDYCDNKAGYISDNLGDGTITVGHGVTNHVISADYAKNFINQNNWGQYFKQSDGKYYMDENMCIPVSVIDPIELFSIETNYASPIDGIAQKYNLKLTQYQKDAITSFNYNLGPDYTEELIKAYKEGGYEGLWNKMKLYVNSTINGVKQELSGLKKRRKAEFALFVTGDYTDQNLFYSRGLDNYDDFNSEGVLQRQAICTESKTDFQLPLDKSSGFQCTSPYGYRTAPTAGASTLHTGLDLGVAGGTDILAAKGGKVIEILDGVTGSSPSTGNYVKIEHEDKTKTSYYHMKNGSVTVKVGDIVSAGDKIGEVGSTGVSTGNHLHFTIYDATGNTVDPYDYLDLSFLKDTSNCHRS